MNANLQNPDYASAVAPTSDLVALPADPPQWAFRPLGIRRILVPIDFSELSLKALDYAAPLAKQFGAAIGLLHVVEVPVYAESPYFAPSEYGELKTLKRELDAIRSQRIPRQIPVEMIVRQNATIDGIVEVARECSADLIITATHGRTGFKHLLLGSKAEDLVRRAPCPVLVVRECERDFV